MKLDIEIETWPLREPFVTARDVMTEVTTLTVVLSDGDHRGRGEALGVLYLAETVDTMASQIRAVQRDIEAGITYITGCGATPGLLTAAAALAAQSFVVFW